MHVDNKHKVVILNQRFIELHLSKSQNSKFYFTITFVLIDQIFYFFVKFMLLSINSPLVKSKF